MNDTTKNLKQTIKGWIEFVVLMFVITSAVIIPIYGAWSLARWIFG